MCTQVLLALSMALVTWACRSALDCELNGVCRNGVCACEPAWRGDTCGELALLPATRGSGYRRDGYSSWGGSVAQAPDGKWVMYAAEMDLHCGLKVWSTNSRIVRAESQTAGGTYTFQSVVKDRFAHEPTLVGPTSDGQYLLLHVGAGRGVWQQNSHQPCTSCANGSTPAVCQHLVRAPRTGTARLTSSHPP